MSYTKYEPYNYKCPTGYFEKYHPNYKKIDTRDVFQYDHQDENITYTPFLDDVPMGNVMEKTFHKKCPQKSKNVFFYPPNAQEFFKKNTDYKQIYMYTCPYQKYYNSTFNQPNIKGQSDILSSACCKIDAPQASPGFSQKTRAYTEDPECFFKNNQLQSSFNNYAQTEPLRTVHKYISSYDKNVNRVSCDQLSCYSSHKDASAL